MLEVTLTLLEETDETTVGFVASHSVPGAEDSATSPFKYLSKKAT